MSLSIGIVGLPNVGKSTVFNALTRTQKAQAANYPFCTIEANRAVVALPDKRLTSLQAWTGVGQAIPARIDFADLAGLVQGASQGEGLGNRFLGHIRDVDAILHVVRCFDDENVVHVQANPNPADDVAVIQTELALADLQQLERRLEKLERECRAEPKQRPMLEMARQVERHIGAGEPLRTFDARRHPLFVALNQEMRFLTAKPVIYAANVDEDSLHADNPHLQAARQTAAAQEAEIITVCAKLEQEMGALSDDEREDYLQLYDLRASSLEQLIRKSYRLLGLISYFTFNDSEVRAWTIRAGWTAPKAAGVIHTDFERGFIRAEVIPYSVFAQCKNRQAVKAAGLMQLEGHDYVVQDGDVIQFRFNV